MDLALIAVVLALVLGHVAPGLGSVRRYGWFIGWLRWLGRVFAGQGVWRGRFGLLLAVGLPVLAIGALQWLLGDRWYGLPMFVFALLALIYTWGPRDLELDVEAVVDARDPAARRAAAAALFPEGGEPVIEGPTLVEAVFRCALWRWFGVLFWFLLLGPFGALLYRLVALCAQGEARRRLPEAASQAAVKTLGVLDWPVAQLMTLALALVGNFDGVFTAWKDTGGASFATDHRYLAAAARASVRSELAEEALDDADGDFELASAAVIASPISGLPELRDAMSLVWRILLLWLAVLALFVIAGWVS